MSTWLFHERNQKKLGELRLKACQLAKGKGQRAKGAKGVLDFLRWNGGNGGVMKCN
ncbi:hypothetical protein CCP4SC76_5410015 [Gammaproteobacteria bacterium]